MMAGEILQTHTIYDRWTTISELQLRMPNGAIETRYVDDHGDAAGILLYDPERRVALLVGQPRAPVIQKGAEPFLEVVAGRLDGKSGEDTARAEALEEAGVEIYEVEKVATLWFMPSVSTERLSLYLASYSQAQRIETGGGAADENECITVHEIALSELWRQLEDDQLPDAKTFTLLQALRLRRPELFV